MVRGQMVKNNPEITGLREVLPRPRKRGPAGAEWGLGWGVGREQQGWAGPYIWRLSLRLASGGLAEGWSRGERATPSEPPLSDGCMSL